MNIYLQKRNWKTFTTQNNGYLKRKLPMVKLQLNAKGVQIPAFYGMADLQIPDKVPSIIKAKIKKSFFGGMRRVLKNTPSKHKQLGRILCIIVILSWHYTGIVFEVPAFDRQYLDSLNKICYHICAYIRWTNYFKFNVFFTSCCYEWVMFLLFATFLHCF